MEKDGDSENCLEANIEKQLMELEILQSIYSNSNEFVIEDEEAVHDAREFLANPKVKRLPSCNLGFVIKFNSDIKDESSGEYYQLPLEIVCRLSKLYPFKTHPDVLVRCLNQKNLNKTFSQDLNAFVKSSHTFDCSILSIIDWVKENAYRYLIPDSASETTIDSASQIPKKIQFSRMFIYSHHIYSMEKRRSIVQMAKELDLHGFAIPGKPGIVCVEGIDSSVQEFWARLRALQWYRIQMKDIKTVEIEKDIFDQVKKFSNFEEKYFSSNNDHSVDMGLFFAFLKQIGLEFVFNLYFGIDGKLPQNNTV